MEVVAVAVEVAEALIHHRLQSFQIVFAVVLVAVVL